MVTIRNFSDAYALVWRRLPLCFGIGVALLLSSVPVLANNKDYALTHAAITVKAPKRISLVALARAGDALVAAGLHGVIIVSKDNGKTWVQAQVPVDLTITALYFPTPQNGWAVGHYGAILATHDGGLTWTRVLTGYDVINAVSKVADAAQKAPSSPLPGGASWQASADTDQRVATAYENDGPSKPFLTIGPCGGGVLAAGQQDMAMFSPASGKSWTEWTSKIQNPDFQDIYEILPEGDSTLLVGENGFLARGDMACRNFTPINGPYSATLFGALEGQNNMILVFGLQGDAYLSNDGGKSWAQVTLGTDAALIAGIALPSGRALLAATNGNLYLSAPGYTSFELLATHVTGVADLVLAADDSIITAGGMGITIIPASTLH